MSPETEERLAAVLDRLVERLQVLDEIVGLLKDLSAEEEAWAQALPEWSCPKPFAVPEADFRDLDPNTKEDK
jgi:hypothetical protein